MRDPRMERLVTRFERIKENLNREERHNYASHINLLIEAKENGEDVLYSDLIHELDYALKMEELNC